MEEILTAEQVAQVLQIHPFTVLKFIKQGKLKASKLGRVYRIRRSEVDRFLDNQIEEPEKTSAEQQKKNISPRKKQKKDFQETKKPSQEIRIPEKTKQLGEQEQGNNQDHYKLPI